MKDKRKYNPLETKLEKFDEQKVLENAGENLELFYLAKRLCKCLDDKKLTESALERETGIPKTTINAYVRAEQKPKIDKLIKMAKYFNVSTDYLLGLSNSPSTKENLKTVYKVTGLSEKTINVLNSMKKSNDNEEQLWNDLRIKTINTLIENEATTHILENISDFLWGNYNTTKNPLATIEDGKLKSDTDHDFVTVREEKSGENLAIPISKFNKIYLLDMEEKLMALREKLQGGKE